MGFSLFPKNERFFDLFSLSASNIRVAAEQFLNLVKDFSNVAEKANRLKEVESAGDSITHEIIDLLNSSFITPIDREDIYALAGKLDDVLDEIEGVASRMHLFAVEKPTLECVAMVEIVVRQTEALEKAVKSLRKFSGMKELLVEIHSLENQADQISRRMVAQLFHNGSSDLINLIKWKEIYARLEHTADRCEDVANVIEDIVVKNA
jgi:predicted phosphate transport protein (TIGR00153 family)